jgi:hypothetical protein
VPTSRSFSATVSKAKRTKLTLKGRLADCVTTAEEDNLDLLAAQRDTTGILTVVLDGIFTQGLLLANAAKQRVKETCTVANIIVLVVPRQSEEVLRERIELGGSRTENKQLGSQSEDLEFGRRLLAHKAPDTLAEHVWCPRSSTGPLHSHGGVGTIVGGKLSNEPENTGPSTRVCNVVELTGKAGNEKLLGRDRYPFKDHTLEH